MLLQPRGEFRDLRSVVGFGCGVPADPAFDLPREKAIRVAEVSQPSRLPIDRVQLHQRRDDRLRDRLTAGVGWLDGIWKTIIEDHAIATLHKIERYTQDRWILADQQRIRGERIRR